MVTYKYCVHDDDGKIKDACFDSFPEAFDYAQNGLITFIEEVPFIDGIEDEEGTEIVWSWDDTWDRVEAIRQIEAKHTDPEDDDFYEDLEVEIKADDPEELASFARCMLGDNCEFFDQEFEEKEDTIPAAELSDEVKVEEPQQDFTDIVLDGEEEQIKNELSEDLRPLDNLDLLIVWAEQDVEHGKPVSLDYFKDCGRDMGYELSEKDYKDYLSLFDKNLPDDLEDDEDEDFWDEDDMSDEEFYEALEKALKEERNK